MMIKHLTLADLERYIQGEETSGYFRQHLQECDECLNKFRDVVSLRHLTRPPGEKPGYQVKASGKVTRPAVRKEAKQHLPEHLLASYYDGTLDPGEMDRVREHLDGCSRCLNEYLALRRSDRTPAADSPSLYVVGEALRRFPGRTSRESLGRARIEKILDRLRIVLIPEPGPAAAMDSLLMEAESAGTLKDRPAYSRIPSDREPSEPEEAALESQERPSIPDREITLEAGDLKIVVSVGQGKKEPILMVRSLDRKTGDPAPGIPLKISPEEGYPSRANTGPDGRAAFILSPGRSRLEVDAWRIFTLDLDFPR